MRKDANKLDLLTLKPVRHLHLNAKDLSVQPIEPSVGLMSYSPSLSSSSESPKAPRKALRFPLAPPPPYDDNYDHEVDALERESRSRFIEGDRIFFSRTGGQHIQIHSGRRTVQRQAELWIGHEQGSPGYSSANLPGCSLHNYGLAIDVIRTNEKLIQESLTGQGWEQTVDDEGWHFECTEARAYALAIIKKKELWNGWAGEWSIAWREIEKAAEERDKIGPEFLIRLDNFHRAFEELKRRVLEHNKQIATQDGLAAQWDADYEDLESRLADINRRIERSNALADQINSMPPGPERESLYQDWLALSGPLEADIARWEADAADLDRRGQYLDQEDARLNQQQQALERERQALQVEDIELQKMASRIEQLEKSIVDSQNRMDTLLTNIESEVTNMG